MGREGRVGVRGLGVLEAWSSLKTRRPVILTDSDGDKQAMMGI